MTDMIYSGPNWSPEEYKSARERLKRLRESPDMNTIPDIVELQRQVATYESVQMVLGSESLDDEHAQFTGIG